MEHFRILVTLKRCKLAVVSIFFSVLLELRNVGKIRRKLNGLYMTGRLID